MASMDKGLAFVPLSAWPERSGGSSWWLTGNPWRSGVWGGQLGEQLGAGLNNHPLVLMIATIRWVQEEVSILLAIGTVRQRWHTDLAGCLTLLFVPWAASWADNGWDIRMYPFCCDQKYRLSASAVMPGGHFKSNWLVVQQPDSSVLVFPWSDFSSSQVHRGKRST